MSQKQEKLVKNALIFGFVFHFLALPPVQAKPVPINIPQLDRTAKAASLGEISATLSGLDALGVNPAALGSGHKEFLAQYRSLALDSNAASLGFGFPILGRRLTASLGYVSMKSGDIEARDSGGNAVGSFNAQDQMVSGHLTMGFPGRWRGVSVGVGAKAIQQKLQNYSGSATALDVGARWESVWVPLVVDASYVNMGDGPTLLTEASTLPTQMQVSGAYKVYKGVTVGGGYMQETNGGKGRVALGTNVETLEMLSVRANYATARYEGGDATWSVGMGLKWKGQKLDYAYTPSGDGAGDTGGTQTLTFTMGF